MKTITLNRSNRFYLLAVIFQVVALLMMALDPVQHGLGILTLWIAPIVLFVGLFLPIIPLMNGRGWKYLKQSAKENQLQTIGFAVSFLVSFVTYLITLEPTASLWDCSETIAAAYKLQVPHTPGTPLTLLFGRLFSMLAFGEVNNAAWCINMMSGFFSALAVGFTFLVIWYFGSQFVQLKSVLLIGGLVGSFMLTFSDSFWFSAVEAETYGPSVFFMVLLIWLSLKPGSLREKEKSNRMLLFSYLLGLSYCIHPMCILILPVCVILWRSEQQRTWWQFTLSFIIGGVIILFISKVIAVDLFEWAFLMDLFAVNTLSLPMYSGVFLMLIVISGLLIFIWQKYTHLKLFVLSLVFLVAGFSPYIMLFVRSTQMPPINEFVPGDLAKIKPYMNRESYPGRPLVYGPYFDAKINEVSTKANAYVVQNEAYKQVGEVPQYHYESDRQTILPRIYSNDPAHVRVYQQWTGLSSGQQPKFSHNLKFMLDYQIGHMYLRYVLWNFGGRISDEQHAGWAKPWSGLISRENLGYNKAYNQYFMLPFLLGIMGLYFHAKKDRRGFVANMTFFLITGLLLTLYLNGTPNEPRERDYIYVGSYLAFCIWVGIGAMWVGDTLKGKKLELVSAILLTLPAWVAYQNWDDHDRSARTFQMDYARSILDSCEEGAILFTGGDNDTFPLWYLQEVEGFRTDVRVKVLSYFNADWYINDLTRDYYDSPPVQLTLQQSSAEYGPYDPVYVQETMDKPISWSKYMDALNARNPNLILKNRKSEFFVLPSRKLSVATEKGNLEVQVSGSYLPKSEMAILDLIASNNWKRPIYFNFTGLHSIDLDLRKYAVQEGQVYRLTTSKHQEDQIPMDLEKSYQNLVTNADYSNLSNEDVYFNYEDFQARMINPARFAFNTLIIEFIRQGDLSKAKEISLMAKETFYTDHLQPSFGNIQLSQILNELGLNLESSELLIQLIEHHLAYVEKVLSDGDEVEERVLVILREAVRILDQPEYKEAYKRLVK
ncbi:glycosyltransferase family 117 protein [Marinoscillum pacificum]|uniref:glycosyltransferase family 117 protein n=1 Tax=Marinoscillum pacificum TaxID=392723 RepID=UPI002157FA6E|nr:DUF2723 domain-containing protein [Marinoscillum pacificum]